MIDLKDLRENPDKYRRGAELKNVKVDVDAVIGLDARRRKLVTEKEEFAARLNALAKDLGQCYGYFKKNQLDLDQAAAEIPPDAPDFVMRILHHAGKASRTAGEFAAAAKLLKEQAAQMRAEGGPIIEELRRVEQQLRDSLFQIPQPPDDDVPVGKDAADNIVVRKWGEPRQFEFEPKSHIELGERLGILDFQAGVRLAGSRSYFLKGAGADLHHAVLRLALDMMTREKGFTGMVVPVMVREAAMRGTGFFPGGREQAYRVGEVDETGEDIRFLTGTAEVALTAYVMPERDETLAEADLPLKLTAVSTCFRREAGTYGKDTAGLYRVHQFDKCEQVVICRNDVAESKRWHAEMLGYSEELLQRLTLPYRVIQCCTGDLGVKNASMMDVETWMPSRRQPGKPDSGYGETHSASRLYEFQARRLNLRYKDKEGKTRFCHTLNNTVVASPRILIPVLENYQNADGSVTVPDVLRPYVGGRERIG